ncbi:sodium:calcium antiporter [Altererythrobacter luteolus]|uniref:Sodium:calcium antiporter n=1 Tax=Pontixanthobacter luteolus TaxID=295089 RepID=A0A6I4V5F6_9SPHN|nr:sodium:calcium antiporter [Pontixanthobacter luteolus]MXP48286.1 sodium:calcium antiporter [Pontixanthobacter luteolus]
MLEVFPLSLLIIAFLLGASAVWWAGTRLPRYVVSLSDKTGLGQGIAGMLVLGGITSLPELATATTAAAIGSPLIALNDVLGSAGFNILLLAAADMLLGPKPLTSVVAKPVTVIQGVLGMMLLALVIAAITAGDQAVFGIAGLWSVLLAVAALAAIRIADRSERRPMWLVISQPDLPFAEEEDLGELDWRQLLVGLTVLAAIILVGGATLAVSATLIAANTGIGGSLMGFLFVAAATSLPELSAITGAIRHHRYELAVGEIFGSNLFNLALIVVIDIVASGPPILELAGPFEATAALLALVLSGIFVLGLVERRDRTIFRMGEDSIAVLVIYAAGLSLLLTIN